MAVLGEQLTSKLLALMGWCLMNSNNSEARVIGVSFSSARHHGVSRRSAEYCSPMPVLLEPEPPSSFNEFSWIMQRKLNDAIQYSSGLSASEMAVFFGQTAICGPKLYDAVIMLDGHGHRTRSADPIGSYSFLGCVGLSPFTTSISVHDDKGIEIETYFDHNHISRDEALNFMSQVSMKFDELPDYPYQK